MTRATRLSLLYSTKYIRLATPFACQSQSTSVVGLSQTYVLREELGELPSEPGTKCLRCVHRHIRGSYSGMRVARRRETICHTTTRATRLSALYITKYICLETPFARQRRSASVVGCNPSFDHLTRSNVVCDGGMEGNAEVRFARVILKREDCTYSIIFIFYRTCHDDCRVSNTLVVGDTVRVCYIGTRFRRSWRSPSCC
ncbi:hypothetical protein EDD15DRAFT_757947 [Pisolithus albus]|nr:hypothetical protein EDD15DRAFT_757947 [Pisolithus albus]